MDYIKILQYEDACKRHEKNSFADIKLDPKVKSATAYIIKDNGFIRQSIIGGAKKNKQQQIFIYCGDTN